MNSQQHKYRNSILFSIMLAIPFCLFGFYTWYSNNYTALPYYGVTESDDTKDHFIVPAFNFVNQEETAVTNAFVKDKIWVADYFFTTCSGTCPIMTNNLQLVQQAFAGDEAVKIISFTVDPSRDSATVLNRYASAHHAVNSQWQFVTGNKKELYAFARRGLFVTATDGDGGSNDFIHSESLVLMDKHGHIRGYYKGTDKAQVEQLIKDIQHLKKEN